jgi:hypothetical protein
MVALTVVCAAEPLRHAVVFDRLLTQPDTRTLAREWIERYIPPGTALAVDSSVALTPTRESLADALVRNAGSLERAGRGARARLALEPYPVPAYRLYHLGAGGLDQDKVFLDPAAVAGPQGRALLRGHGVEYVVLDFLETPESTPLRRRIRSFSTLALRVSPFRVATEGGRAQLPERDVRPSLAVRHPGPVIEVWRLAGGKS